MPRAIQTSTILSEILLRFSGNRLSHREVIANLRDSYRQISFVHRYLHNPANVDFVA